MNFREALKQLRANALIVNNVEYGLVKIDNQPHSFVQIANVAGMTVDHYNHSLSSAFLSPMACIPFKHGNFDLYMRKWDASRIPGRSSP